MFYTPYTRGHKPIKHIQNAVVDIKDSTESTLMIELVRVVVHRLESGANFPCAWRLVAINGMKGDLRVT